MISLRISVSFFGCPASPISKRTPSDRCTTKGFVELLAKAAVVASTHGSAGGGLAGLTSPSRSALTLAGIVGLVIAVARIVSAVQSETGKPAVAVARPTPASTPPPVRGEANSSPEPQVRKAEPVPKPSPEPDVRRAERVYAPKVEAVPTPSPRLVAFYVGPKEWSDLFHVPHGKRASVEFSLGRIKIERNGKDLGTFAHSRATRERHDLGYGVSIVPYRKPETVYLTTGTRSVRVMSDEDRSGEVVLRWSD